MTLEKLFSKLKQAIASKPVLCLHDLGKPFEFNTDALDKASGSVLAQRTSFCLRKQKLKGCGTTIHDQRKK